jgi:argininosuccinate lyase
MVDAIQSQVRTPRAVLLNALDPVNFVNVRRIPGGPAPEPVLDAIREAEAEIMAVESWLATKAALLEAYPKRIKEAQNALLKRP